ncbi:heavy-metal-associated domain-containing protein [Myxococcota bacterium]|nr:heavy-metal-associated domain-containing protein [Myxococcota bacterium]
MSETTFDVIGMSCMNCVRHVTEAVKKIEGVKDVAVTLETGKVKVQHDGRDALEGAVIGALTEEGYEAKRA